MQIAQEEASGIASGMPGHWRPNNLTLGQWLMSLGYPLSGDLYQDGYRSENWMTAQTSKDAVQAWLGDEPHTNTMLSPYRSDIGAGIAATEDGYILVIETALQTTSGQMQSNANAILTGIPLTQQAYNASATLAAENGSLPQYSLPIAIATANLGGDVIHEVQYGQTLWSIAITYGTTIKEIQRLNNWNTEDVYVGQQLLVMKGATPPPQVTPVSVASAFPTLQPTSTAFIASPSPTTQPNIVITTKSPQEMTLSVAAIALAALVLGIIIAFPRRKEDG
ncbi:MAG: LysM peptidoglycan-binding domain-containing protein [Anaerolineales bacterium]|nr:LysM peptidoglycan-binding domain-containing protein [Anaerolineales bacterium]MCL4261124.1 LysM peptidoglycan-binding domain-containing protein [Anaerolineales bacterium]